MLKPGVCIVIYVFVGVSGCQSSVCLASQLPFCHYNHYLAVLLVGCSREIQTKSAPVKTRKNVLFRDSPQTCSLTSQSQECPG